MCVLSFFCSAVAQCAVPSGAGPERHKNGTPLTASNQSAAVFGRSFFSIGRGDGGFFGCDLVREGREVRKFPRTCCARPLARRLFRLFSGVDIIILLAIGIFSLSLFLGVGVRGPQPSSIGLLRDTAHSQKQETRRPLIVHGLHPRKPERTNVAFLKKNKGKILEHVDGRIVNTPAPPALSIPTHHCFLPLSLLPFFSSCSPKQKKNAASAAATLTPHPPAKKKEKIHGRRSCRMIPNREWPLHCCNGAPWLHRQLARGPAMYARQSKPALGVVFCPLLSCQKARFRFVCVKRRNKLGYKCRARTCANSNKKKPIAEPQTVIAIATTTIATAFGRAAHAKPL
nr:hypothetical protein [Pandoravirus massiliensis]